MPIIAPSYDNPAIAEDPSAYIPSTSAERVDPMGGMNSAVRSISTHLQTPDQDGSMIMQPADLRKTFGTDVDSSEPMRTQDAYNVYAAKKEADQQAYAMSRSPQRTAGVRATDFLMGNLSPQNLALMAIPGVGEEAVAARMFGEAAGGLVAKGGIRALDSLGQRMAARAATGAASGVAVGAIAEPFNIAQAQEQGQEYGATDALYDIGMSGVYGGAFHAAGGALADGFSNVMGRERYVAPKEEPTLTADGTLTPPSETPEANELTLMNSVRARQDAIATAIDQVTKFRKPVSVDELVNAHSAQDAGFDLDKYESLERQRQAEADHAITVDSAMSDADKYSDALEKTQKGQDFANARAEATARAADLEEAKSLGKDIKPYLDAHTDAQAALESAAAKYDRVKGTQPADLNGAREQILWTRIAGLKENIDNLRAEAASLDAPAVDPITADRIKAIDDEMPTASAARKAKLQAERDMITSPTEAEVAAEAKQSALRSSHAEAMQDLYKLQSSVAPDSPGVKEVSIAKRVEGHRTEAAQMRAEADALDAKPKSQGEPSIEDLRDARQAAALRKIAADHEKKARLQDLNMQRARTARAAADTAYRIRMAGISSKQAVAVSMTAKSLRTWAYKAGHPLERAASEEMARAIASGHMDTRSAIDLIKGGPRPKATATVKSEEPWFNTEPPEPPEHEPPTERTSTPEGFTDGTPPITGETVRVPNDPPPQGPTPEEVTAAKTARMEHLKTIAERSTRIKDILHAFGDSVGSGMEKDAYKDFADRIMRGEYSVADALADIRTLGHDEEWLPSVDPEHWRDLLGKEAWSAAARAHADLVSGSLPDPEMKAIADGVKAASAPGGVDKMVKQSTDDLKAYEAAAQKAGVDTTDGTADAKEETLRTRAKAVASAMACMLGLPTGEG